jgi:hypothetical protein
LLAANYSLGEMSDVSLLGGTSGMEFNDAMRAELAKEHGENNYNGLSNYLQNATDEMMYGMAMKTELDIATMRAESEVAIQSSEKNNLLWDAPSSLAFEKSYDGSTMPVDGIDPYLLEQDIAQGKQNSAYFFKGLASTVTEPVLMSADVATALYGLASNTPDLQMWSSMGKAVEQGASRGSLWARSIPVVSTGFTAYDLTTAYINGDTGTLFESAGSLVGGFAFTKIGESAFAPEPGAQVGVVRLSRKGSSDLIDFNNVSSGNLPPLPKEHIANFTDDIVPLQFGRGELVRLFEQGDESAEFNGRYWATEIPATEDKWRSLYGVLKKWPDGSTNAGTDVAMLQRSSTWAWFGKTAPQAVVAKYAFRMGDYHVGWYQAGGKPQAMIPNAKNIVNQSNTVFSASPWSKKP